MAKKPEIRIAVETDLRDRKPTTTIGDVAKAHGLAYNTVWRWHDAMLKEGRYDAPKTEAGE